MTNARFDDTTLMAFADGELEDSLAREVAAAIAADRELARRVEMFRETRRMAKAAFADELAQPVPAALRDKIDTMIKAQRTADRQEPASPTNARPARRRFDWTMPIAASIAALAGALAGYWLAFQGIQGDHAHLALGRVGEPQLSAALSNLPSGSDGERVGAGRLRIIGSFRDGRGVLCREFEINRDDSLSSVAIACRDAGHWTLTFAQTLGSAEGGYAPADAAPVVDAYLQAIGAGPPLTAAEEKTLLDSGG